MFANYRVVAIVLAVLATANGCRVDLTAEPAANEVEVKHDADDVRRTLDDVLEYTLNRRLLNTVDHGAWQVLHGVLAFQRDFPIQVGKNGKIEPAVDYLLNGGSLDGWSLRPGTTFDDGRVGVKAILAPGSKRGQGHYDQWLAYLAQCGLSADQPIQVAGRTHTLADLIRQTQFDVATNSDHEFSWTVIGLSAYLPTGVQWKASDGEMWDVERLVAIELDQNLHAGACGGTHRMIGLAAAVNSHVAAGGAVTGAWTDAEKLIQRCVADARSMQNPDGSFSAHYFQRPGQSADLATTLGTTGHILEFLSLALTSEKISELWVERAAVRLCELFRTTEEISPECGALYHAAHGLVLYRHRRFGPRSYVLVDPGESNQ